MSMIEVTTALPEFKGLKAIQENMRSILGNAGVRLNRLVSNHIRTIAAERHATANRLGAKPTGHFKASDVLPAKVNESDNSVTVTVTTPGIVRAVKDVTILPKEAKSLAIPLHASAYGIQPRELNDRGEYEMFRIKQKGSKEPGNILYRRDGDELVPMYLLVRRVFQKKDESLMPNQTQMMREAVNGAESAIRLILERNNK